MIYKPIRAFHSFWTVPYRMRHNQSVEITDYELLTLVLSALTWQKYNGPIQMITDTPGRALFLSLGLETLWSDGISATLDELSGIDPFVFWAAGKLYALDSVDGPCVMLDTDLIVWENIRCRLGPDVTAVHPEELNSPVYPDPHEFEATGTWRLPEAWDLTVQAANTAFMYIRDDELRHSYVQEAFHFMRSMTEAEAHLEPTMGMCFAEQRILPMHAAAQGKTTAYLFDMWDMYVQRFVTHVWGFKRILEESAEARKEFCRICLMRIADEYPRWHDILLGVSSLRQYV